MHAVCCNGRGADWPNRNRVEERVGIMLENPVRVFIVDDSPYLREMLCELLSDPGTIDIVGSGESALTAAEEVQRLNADVVIIDLQLKGGSGFDVVKGVRRLPRAKDIITIIFTNHASPALHEHALALGADYFLDKSNDHDKIIAILQAKVRSRQT